METGVGGDSPARTPTCPGDWPHHAEGGSVPSTLLTQGAPHAEQVWAVGGLSARAVSDGASFACCITDLPALSTSYNDRQPRLGTARAPGARTVGPGRLPVSRPAAGPTSGPVCRAPAYRGG